MRPCLVVYWQLVKQKYYFSFNKEAIFTATKVILQKKDNFDIEKHFFHKNINNYNERELKSFLFLFK